MGNLVERIHRHRILGWLIKDLAESLGVQKESIAKNSSLKKDLGLGNMDRYGLRYRIEKRFGIIISKEDALQISTLESYVNYIMTKKQYNP